jgi:hypothetical protein
VARKQRIDSAYNLVLCAQQIRVDAAHPWCHVNAGINVDGRGRGGVIILPVGPYVCLSL